MNNLEYEIKEFIINHDLTNITVKQIADKFYVSRPHIYRVINKMGYHSLQELQEKKLNNGTRSEDSGLGKIIMDYDVIDSNVIFELAEDIVKAKNVYIVGYYVSEVLALYLSRQLVNLKVNAIPVVDVYQLKGYSQIITDSDAIICISNTGEESDISDSISLITHKKYVITKFQSDLYNREKHSIGIKNNINEISNRFECENILEAMLVIQICLNEVVKIKNEYFFIKH